MLEKNEQAPKPQNHIIIEVVKGSIAEEVGIEAGDSLVSINGQEIQDALDFHLFVQESDLEIAIIKGASGEEWIIEVEKEEYEDLGLVFENNLMDEYKSCTNKCVFCFIDQLPLGMRETLYFKDDDARLSFLQGNYITLTNMKEKDVERIIRYNLSPINISIHTMDMDLRKEMLNNRFADKIKGYMDRFNEAGITMNGQIVLCKGINDGSALEYSIEALTAYLPNLQSVSIVPVGLSRYREGLYPLEPFTKDDAQAVIELVDKWQQRLIASGSDLHFIHAADEFYFMAEAQMPEEGTYDGYLQLENGVGMTRLLLEEFEFSFDELKGTRKPNEVSIATGTLIAPVIRNLADRLTEKFPDVICHVHPIVNNFFGECITVSGLLTGQDIIEQLKGRQLGQRLLLPSNLLKNAETVLLDDVTVDQISQSLEIPVMIVDLNGTDLIQAITG